MPVDNSRNCQKNKLVNISENLDRAIVSNKPVSGLTHNFYRYPARFSPEFAKQTIQSFTKNHDCVLDPFVGGGTSIVEALALGRRAIGIDINSLACFVSNVKTTPLSSNDINSIIAWSKKVLVTSPSMDLQINSSSISFFRNMPPEIACFLVHASILARELPFNRQRRFAHCAVIRTGQLSLDCRRKIPDLLEVKITFERTIQDMVAGHNEFVSAIKSYGIPKYKITSMRKIFWASSGGSSIDRIIASYPVKPTLVLTSPPYPQTHILYNKWQVLGRRETTAHYALADLRDGRGPSYYTMGSRSEKGLNDYLQQLLKIFRNLRTVIDSNAIVAQLVAFPDEDMVMAKYLSMMQQSGFEPVALNQGGTLIGSRCRTVPNRRWYAYCHEKQASSREIFMIHRVKR